MVAILCLAHRCDVAFPSPVQTAVAFGCEVISSIIVDIVCVYVIFSVLIVFLLRLEDYATAGKL